MDLTTEVAHKVIFYLGYPAKTIQKDSTHFNGILLQRTQKLTQETKDRVDELVALIDETRTQMDATRADSSVTSVGE